MLHPKNDNNRGRLQLNSGVSVFGLALEQRKALVLLHERGQKALSAVRLSAGLMTRLDAYVSAASPETLRQHLSRKPLDGIKVQSVSCEGAERKNLLLNS